MRELRLVGLLTALVLLLAGCSATGADEPTRSGSSAGYVSGDRSITVVAPADRKPAPVLAGTSLGSDRTLSTADYAGKVVVLNVWGSWCGPCRAEAADLQQASEQTATVAQFIGLNTKDLDPAPAQAFVRSFKITYPSLYDPTGSVLVRLSADLPPKGIPSTLIIDPDGRVAARIVGTISAVTLVDLINDVADGK